MFGRSAAALAKDLDDQRELFLTFTKRLGKKLDKMDTRMDKIRAERERATADLDEKIDRFHAETQRLFSKLILRMSVGIITLLIAAVATFIEKGALALFHG